MRRFYSNSDIVSAIFTNSFALKDRLYLRQNKVRHSGEGYNHNMKTYRRYLPLIALSILALLAAMWAGLLRLGWPLPAFPRLASAHGPLMVCGFLGTLIPLERAVAIRRKWMFAAPILTAAGWVFLLARPDLLGAVLFTLGSLVMLVILGFMVYREPKIHAVVMAGGGLAWVVGNVLWITGMPLFQMVFWWMAFLVLTIAGERLELNRVLYPSPGQIRIFGIFTALLFAGAVVGTFNLSIGTRLSGAGLLTLGLWFLANDIARRNLRHPMPLTRYIACCLFAGFLWLLVGGGVMLVIGAQYAGPFYDAMLHIVFVGFVMSMIFGHAPIIFPAIVQVRLIFQPAFYIHLLLLHLSLLVRVAGDMASLQTVRQWGGLLNEVAILLFLALTGHALWNSKRTNISQK
jgi:hypothetical protein